MTTQQYPQQTSQVRPDVDLRQQDRDRQHVVRDVRETKPSMKTTEFWVMLVAVAGILIASYADSDSFSRDDGWLYVTLVVVAYLVSRGLAKVASYDRVDRDWNDR